MQKIVALDGTAPSAPRQELIVDDEPADELLTDVQETEKSVVSEKSGDRRP